MANYQWSDLSRGEKAEIAQMIVVPDQTDGHTYRLITTNGVVSAVQVT